MDKFINVAKKAIGAEHFSWYVVIACIIILFLVTQYIYGSLTKDFFVSINNMIFENFIGMTFTVVGLRYHLGMGVSSKGGVEKGRKERSKHDAKKPEATG